VSSWPINAAGDPDAAESGMNELASSWLRVFVAINAAGYPDAAENGMWLRGHPRRW
jgi:hypothetical protein